MTYRRITTYNATGQDVTIFVHKKRMDRLRTDPEARKELQRFLEPKIREARNYMQAAPVVCRFMPGFAALPSATKFTYNGEPQSPEVIMQTLQRNLRRYQTSLKQLERLDGELREMDRIDSLSPPSEAERTETIEYTYNGGTPKTEYTIRVELPRT